MSLSVFLLCTSPPPLFHLRTYPLRKTFDFSALWPDVLVVSQKQEGTTLRVALLSLPQELFYVLSIKLFSHTRTVYSFTSLISLPSFIRFFFTWFSIGISSQVPLFLFTFVLFSGLNPCFCICFLQYLASPLLCSLTLFIFFLFMYIPPELDTGNFPVS